MGLKWLAFLIGPLYLVGMWFGEYQRANIIRQKLKRGWTTSSNINNYSTLNNEHNGQELCVLLRNQQVCTSNSHN